MPPTLRLNREPNFVAELRRGPFEIRLDGQPAGSIETHQTVELPIEPGHHAVQVRFGRYSSRPRSFDVGLDEVVTFRCSGGVIWPIYLASLVKTDLALVLQRQATA